MILISWQQLTLEELTCRTDYKVTQIISNHLNVNIKSININTEDGIFEGIITLKIHNVSFLKQLTKNLEKLKGYHQFQELININEI